MMATTTTRNPKMSCFVGCWSETTELPRFPAVFVDFLDGSAFATPTCHLHRPSWPLSACKREFENSRGKQHKWLSKQASERFQAIIIPTIETIYNQGNESRKNLFRFRFIQVIVELLFVRLIPLSHKYLIFFYCSRQIFTFHNFLVVSSISLTIVGTDPYQLFTNHCRQSLRTRCLLHRRCHRACASRG